LEKNFFLLKSFRCNGLRASRPIVISIPLRQYIVYGDNPIMLNLSITNVFEPGFAATQVAHQEATNAPAGMDFSGVEPGGTQTFSQKASDKLVTRLAAVRENAKRLLGPGA
jgi:hypothetical protein